MLEKIIEISMLNDFYGQLLTAKQREILKLYHEDNYSLSEIAEELRISRQGVHDALKKAENVLHEYERKLGMINKFIETEKAIKEIDHAINLLIIENKENEKLAVHLNKIKEIIDRVNE